MSKQKQKIWDKTKKALKLAGYVFALSIVVSVVLNEVNLMNLTAFAAEDPSGDIGSKMGFWAQVFQKAIWPVVIMVGGLLDNSLLFGKGMEQTLLDIWVPVRNMVNIIVVVVLVGIALYNVLGIGGDEGSYTIKKMLPNLIIGIIAINFSFVGIKVFLDAINVMTTAIFALPTEVGAVNIKFAMDSNSPDICAGYSGLSGAEMKEPIENPNNMIENWTFGISRRKATFYAESYSSLCQGDNNYKPELTAAMNECAGKTTKALTDECITPALQGLIGSGCTQFKQTDADQIKTNFDKNEENGICLATNGKINPKFFEQYGRHNAALVLAVTMGKIAELPKIDFKSVTDIKNMAIGTVFTVLMYIVYVISFIALGIVLMGRIVVLWISIALSPIILLLMFVPTVKEKAGGLKKITDEFVRNAIAPLIIAIPLSVGFIMLSAVKHNIGGNNIGETTGLAISTGIPVAGMNTLESLIAMCGTLALIWIGVFEAAENTIAGSVTGAIKGFGQKIGGYLLQKPLEHFPLAPIKGLEGQKLTLRDVFSAASHIRLPGEGTSTAGGQAILNKVGWGGTVGSNNISDLSIQTDVNQALGTLHQAGHIGGGKKEELEATQEQLRLMQNKPMYKELIAKIAEKTGKDQQAIKTKLDDFVRNGKVDTNLAEWIKDAYNKITAPGGDSSTPPHAAKTAAKEEDVSKAKKQFGGKITTNTAIKSDSNAQNTIEDTTNFSKEKFIGNKTAILKDNTQKQQWQGVTKAIIDEIKKSYPDKKFTPAQLKTIIDNDNLYDIMQEAVGGESGIVKLLK